MVGGRGGEGVRVEKSGPHSNRHPHLSSLPLFFLSPLSPSLPASPHTPHSRSYWGVPGQHALKPYSVNGSHSDWSRERERGAEDGRRPRARPPRRVVVPGRAPPFSASAVAAVTAHQASATSQAAAERRRMCEGHEKPCQAPRPAFLNAKKQMKKKKMQRHVFHAPSLSNHPHPLSHKKKKSTHTKMHSRSLSPPTHTTRTHAGEQDSPVIRCFLSNFFQ
jgi:hypothetical protein